MGRRAGKSSFLERLVLERQFWSSAARQRESYEDGCEEGRGATCAISPPGESTWFLQSEEMGRNLSKDTIEHRGLSGRGQRYDKAVPVSDSSGQGAQGCATTALDGGNFRVTLWAPSATETLMGKLASLLGTQNAGSELNTWGRSSVNLGRARPRSSAPPGIFRRRYEGRTLIYICAHHGWTIRVEQ